GFAHHGIHHAGAVAVVAHNVHQAGGQLVDAFAQQRPGRGLLLVGDRRGIAVAVQRRVVARQAHATLHFLVGVAAALQLVELLGAGVHHHQVAAVLLGHVQGAVAGFFQVFFAVHVGGVKLGDAEAGADRQQAPTVVMELGAGDLVAHALGGLGGVFFAGAAAHDAELFAAVAVGRVALARFALEDGGD